MARCSIVISHPQAKPAALLQALHAAARFEVELFVLGDMPTSQADSLAASGARLAHHAYPADRPPSAFLNEIAAQATGPFLIFLNGDVVPEPDALTELLHHAEEHPDAAVIGTRVLDQGGWVSHCGIVIGQDGLPRNLYRGFPADHPATRVSREYRLVGPGCFLVTRDAFTAVGGFSEAFPAGYEYIDLMLRIGRAGLGRAIHHCHRSQFVELAAAEAHPFQSLHDPSWFRMTRWYEMLAPDDIDYYLRDQLVRLHYPPAYPLEIDVSPLLATVAYRDPGCQVVRPTCAAAKPVIRDVTPSPENRSRRCQPVLVSEGTIHNRKAAGDKVRISVLMPTKNGQGPLRQNLPKVLNQDIDLPFEIIAIDSGSQDGTVEFLQASGVRVFRIDPATFDHGLTRNAAAEQARGDLLVFLNQSTIPADETWMRNLVAPLLDDPLLAGVCSRVLPRPEADILVRKDCVRDLSGSPFRTLRQIADRTQYDRLDHHARRSLINFHTVSAAIRREVLRRFPFQSVLLGEDILWTRDVLEAGYRVLHEPASTVYHSHDYTLLEILMRNIDDGRANQQIVARQFGEDEVHALLRDLVRDDWRYLEQATWQRPAEIEQWKVDAVLRRTAQLVGQWIGVNCNRLPEELVAYFSLVGRIKASRSTRQLAA